MTPSNKEMQLRKNCELYLYLLAEQDKEIPEDILECAMSYDYPIDCVQRLLEELKSLDSQTFEDLVVKSKSDAAHDLRNWIEMQKEADRLHKMLSSDV